MNINDRLAGMAARFTGRMGLAAQLTNSEEPLLLNAGEVYPTASCMKVPILVDLFSQAREGTVSLDERLCLRGEDQVPGTGVLKDLTPGIQLGLLDLAALAITVSDNTAANMLIGRLGKENINQRMSVMGFDDIWLDTYFVFENPERNVGSPESFLTLLLGLANRTLMPSEDCDQVLQMMTRQHFRDYIPRYLPCQNPDDPSQSGPSVVCANKVGMFHGITNDMGVVDCQDLSYAIVVFTRDARDKRWGPDGEGPLLIAKASRAVYEYFLSL